MRLKNINRKVDYTFCKFIDGTTRHHYTVNEWDGKVYGYDWDTPKTTEEVLDYHDKWRTEFIEELIHSGNTQNLWRWRRDLSLPEKYWEQGEE